MKMSENQKRNTRRRGSRTAHRIRSALGSNIKNLVLLILTNVFRKTIQSGIEEMLTSTESKSQYHVSMEPETTTVRQYHKDEHFKKPNSRRHFWDDESSADSDELGDLHEKSTSLKVVPATKEFRPRNDIYPIGLYARRQTSIEGNEQNIASIQELFVSWRTNGSRYSYPIRKALEYPDY